MEPAPPSRNQGLGCILAVVCSLVLWGMLVAGTWLLAQGIHHVLHH